MLPIHTASKKLSVSVVFPPSSSRSLPPRRIKIICPAQIFHASKGSDSIEGSENLKAAVVVLLRGEYHFNRFNIYMC